MDLATLIGIVGAAGCIIAAIMMGGEMGMFVNGPSVMIVVAGTLAVVLMKFSMSDMLGAFGVALKAFINKAQHPAEIIEQSVELANVARKDGLLGLENVEVKNEFLAKGITMVVDGNSPELVSKILSKEITLSIERNETGVNLFKAMGDVAPAMGMIGTLIGLVQMMSNMSDPKSIGPAMAVALLTTLYGAVIANVLALPIADKLALRSNEERLSKSMILESISAIQEGLNPRMIEGLLNVYLPIDKKSKAKAKAEAEDKAA
ncbi:MAG TPA: flagellar motor protein PomA [Gammaproteobacteria bacterium]|nr:flagellar motor protein PomA [Gammaproteobacteria bacterium]